MRLCLLDFVVIALEITVPDLEYRAKAAGCEERGKAKSEKLRDARRRGRTRDGRCVGSCGHGVVVACGVHAMRQRNTLPIGLSLDRGMREPLVESSPPCQRPPVVQEDFQRPPVRDPAKDKETLFDQALEGRVDKVSCGNMR